MYDVYLDTMLLPVTPSKIQVKIKNQNKTITLMNDGEINLLKMAGLSDISFTALIPQLKYPFAQGEFKGASFFLDGFEKLKTDQKPFQFIIYRALPNGTLLFDSNFKVSLEDYQINEDADNGFDLTVDINLKQYRRYGTKAVQMQEWINRKTRPRRSSNKIDPPKPRRR